MTLTDFLLARIAEDEVQARSRWRPDDSFAVRVLAECGAKRRIVEESHARAIVFLAAIYADHPDYREEWKP